MRINLGVVTMARAGGVTKKVVTQKPTVVPRIIPHIDNTHLQPTKPMTPTLPKLTPGTVTMLESRAGKMQDPGVTYETQENSAAPFMTVNKTAEPEKKSSALLPLAAIAAYFLLG